MKDSAAESTEPELARVARQASELLAADPAAARALARRAATLAEEREDLGALARSQLVLGRSYLPEAAFEKAESELGRALEAARRSEDRALIIEALRDLLKCAFYARDLDAALLRGMQGLRLAREFGDPLSEARLHNDIGLVYGNLGEFGSSLEHLLSALRLMRPEGVEPLGSVLNNIGNVYLELDDPRQALDFFRQALASFREEGAWRGEAIAFGNVGRAAQRLGQLADAVEAFRASLAMYEFRGAESYALPALTRLASALAESGDHEGARDAFENALERQCKAATLSFADEVLSGAGRYFLEIGEVDRSIELFRGALGVLWAGANSRAIYPLYEALADAYERKGDFAEALAQFREYHRLKQSVADSAIDSRTRGLMLQFDVERVRQQEEIFRLRNVELARANEELRRLQERLESQNRELHRISIEDSLTGLHNRRYLTPRLEEEVARARRHSRPLCAAMCDIDHFKEINDRHSHALGDEVLKRIATLIRETARETDIVSRYGGEEFLLVLPDTDLAGAEVLTERLRVSVAGHPWSELAPGLRVTISIGVARLERRAGAAQLVAAADSRLYGAKRTGRDRVVA
jgi:diguanylate cyclase (GGDEF)-like protein